MCLSSMQRSKKVFCIFIGYDHLVTKLCWSGKMILDIFTSKQCLHFFLLLYMLILFFFSHDTSGIFCFYVSIYVYQGLYFFRVYISKGPFVCKVSHSRVLQLLLCIYCAFYFSAKQYNIRSYSKKNNKKEKQTKGNHLS